MTVEETPAGTPVVELTREEYNAYLESEVRHATGMTVTDFTRAYEACEVDDGDPGVSEVVVLLRIGQDGHRAA